ncbi:MAG: hypothetical protein HYX69_08495 [Planctomycetia bacterium]|nr:hypothetical protein [Planctomycetia bacterium]
MKKYLGYGLALAIVLGFCAAQVLARGGHGGGHGGHHGGHHSGHHGHSGHHHHANNHHASHNAHHHAHWANHNRPFSRGWYGYHRGAWGGGWGWGNPWNVANWGTTAAWLGLGAAAAPAWGGYGPTNTAIYDTDNEDLNAPASEFATGQNVSPEALAAESAAAKQLAAKGTTDPVQGEKFLPLGVFTLAPENETEASAMLQLAVSKQGVLRGSYYDLLSDADHPIRGSVDKKTQRVAWTFGPRGKVTFQTALAALTEPSGPVSVHYENGQTRQWVLARYDKEPAENDPQDDESGNDSGDNKTSNKSK